MEEQGRMNRVRPVKADVPAFWSVSQHGQPWSDERLAKGATEWQVAPDHRQSGVKLDPGLIQEQRKGLRM
eukprot:scaffold486417_cov51-Prasinocladus_malaysianus.AAC.1